jgi:hypothetical protein
MSLDQHTIFVPNGVGVEHEARFVESGHGIVLPLVLPLLQYSYRRNRELDLPDDTTVLHYRRSSVPCFATVETSCIVRRNPLNLQETLDFGSRAHNALTLLATDLSWINEAHVTYNALLTYAEMQLAVEEAKLIEAQATLRMLRGE